jgi:hypothetical protein
MKRVALAAPFVLVTAACLGNRPYSAGSFSPNPASSYSLPTPAPGRSASPPVTATARSYSRPAPVPAPPPSTHPPAPTPSRGGDFRWAGSVREAQDAARAAGKMVLVEAGRAACGNCQKLKNQVIPAVSSDLGGACVGYYLDVDYDTSSATFLALRNNIVGAGSLPLVGFFTPDMRWLHGFWGGRGESALLQELATARSQFRRVAGLDVVEPVREVAAAPATAISFDRSLPAEELADVTAALGEEAGTPLVSADAPPAIAAAPAEVLVPSPVQAPASSEPAPVATAAPPPSAVEGPAPAAPAPVDPEASTRSWARDSLEKARVALEGRDFATARALLDEVRERASGLPESREAEKGDVAIYLLKRSVATPAEKGSIADRACRVLKGTLWLPLFGC